jgi:transcriptional regulator with XRE-family HTH domain
MKSSVAYTNSGGESRSAGARGIEVSAQVHSDAHHHFGERASSGITRRGGQSITALDVESGHPNGESRATMQNRIRHWREVRGLKQEQLAEAVGTSPQQISRLELSDRKLNDDWLRRLAVALNVRKADLIVERDGIEPSLREFAQDADEVRLLLSWRSLEDTEKGIFRRFLQSIRGAELDDLSGGESRGQ